MRLNQIAWFIVAEEGIGDRDLDLALKAAMRAEDRTQLERAATSIPLNIAEGNVKPSPRDRRRYWEIALGSTVECAAILDVLVARQL